MDVPGLGVRLRATRWAGSGTPVVLLHGLASQRRFWNLVVPGLVGPGGGGVPVVAVDQRGHGDSQRPAADTAGGYSVSTCAHDLANALDALGIGPAVVVGHSWGGSVALAFAAEHPERVRAVVAIDGGFMLPPSEPRHIVRDRLAPPGLALQPEELTALLKTAHVGRWTSALAEAVLPIFEVSGEDGLARARLPRDLHMAVLDGLLDMDPRTLLPLIACPAWLISCEDPRGDSEWVARKAEGLEVARALLAVPRIFRWGGAVHDVPLQWPQLVSGLIRAAVEDSLDETMGNRIG